MVKPIKPLVSTLLAIAALTGLGASAATPALAATKENQKLLTFSATTVDGKSYKSTQLLRKPSVIWFWTPWCAICRNESKAVSQLSVKYAGKVNFIGIGANGSESEMKEFISLQKTTKVIHLNDASGKLWSRFGVVIQPTLVFVDKNGRIETHIGPSTASYISKKTAALAK
jgi:thiol-disulfide isomerase/thioredoxin